MENNDVEKRDVVTSTEPPHESAADRRRQRKSEQVAKKAAEKQSQAATTNGNAEEMDPRLFFENRCKFLEEYSATKSPYPHKFHVSLTIPQFIKKYTNLADGEHLENEQVTIAGRLTRVSASGQKLRFYDIRGDNEKLQVMANFAYHDSSTGEFTKCHDIFRRGDIVGIRGFPGKSKRGELSVFPREIILLTPCLHMLPERNALKDIEVRYRQRYMDLIINDFPHRVFKIRSQVVQFIRQYLQARDFIEVETPMMTKVFGGAAARPFITHHNDLDMDLYMRIAPELYLKMLVVGGMDRVFEIGKNFRNEGIDMTHNPEFTSCEFYWAYADYQDLINLTEHMISSMVLEIHGSYKIPFHPHGHDGECIELDFTPPYKRFSMVEAVEEYSNTKLPRPLDSEECIKVMISILEKEGCELPHPQTSAKLLDALSSHFIESRVHEKPAFITEHPQIMSPLAKWHRSKPELTERFELFIMGKELCNAYTELNDPKVQRACFEDQVKAKAAGDDEACPIDENFCTALEFGLPPTGGWGIGIDRLTMFLSDQITIKEVILFPAMRPPKREAIKPTNNNTPPTA